MKKKFKIKIKRRTLIGDKSLPNDMFLDVIEETNAVKVNKKKSFADIYEEIYFKAEEIDNLPEQLLGLREAAMRFRQLMANPSSEKMQYFPFPTKEKIKYVDTLYKERIAYLEARINSQLTYPDFKPKDGLDEVIYKDFIFQFGEIEKELILREYLNEKYQWQQNKKKFCEFLVVIIDYKYLKVSDVKARRFFEKRYGRAEKFLSEMFKFSKRPKFKTAEINFSFISRPEKN